MISAGDSMAQAQDNFKRGTAEMLVLYLLEQEDMYAYQIVNELNKRSGERYRLLEGSLSMILLRMEEAGLITGRIELVGKRRTRRYYTILPLGKERLASLMHDYQETALGIQSIIDFQREETE